MEKWNVRSRLMYIYLTIIIGSCVLADLTCQSAKQATRAYVKEEVMSARGFKFASISFSISVDGKLDNGTDNITPEIAKNIYSIMQEPLKILKAKLEKDYGLKTNLAQLLKDKPMPTYEMTKGFLSAHFLRIGDVPREESNFIAIELGLLSTKLTRNDFRIWCGVSLRENTLANPRNGILYSDIAIKKENAFAWLSNLNKLTAPRDSLLNRVFKDYPDFEGDLRDMKPKSFYDSIFYENTDKRQKDLVTFAYASVCNSKPLLK